MLTEELNVWCSSPNIIWMVVSGRMMWREHVARTGGKDVHKGFRSQNLREINHFEAQEVHLVSY